MSTDVLVEWIICLDFTEGFGEDSSDDPAWQPDTVGENFRILHHKDFVTKWIVILFVQFV